MTSRRNLASLSLCLLTLTSLLSGCPDGGMGERPDTARGLDAAMEENVDAFSRDDAFGGPDVRTTPACGDVGQACCGDVGTCSAGRRCETDLCCAVPGAGVACDAPEDCCGGADCVGGACCSLQGTSCRTSAECCSDLLCESGTCTLPVEDCGRDGGACCPGDECRAGSVCAGGRCETCGGDGEICCAAPGECAAGLACSAGRCGTPDPTCGGADQPCCTGDRCMGELACTSGTCTMPTTECAYLDCGECTSHYPCGWCSGTGTCSAGDSDGPATGSCGDWAWVASECAGPTDPCADATTCDACTARPGCGFCDGACRSGDSTGPTAGSCTGDWSWIASECAGPVDTCAMNTDCASCTGASSCGWCTGTSTCRSGTSAGPSAGTCSGTWSWLSSSCPMVDTCGMYDSCLDCTDATGCGYCATTGTCVAGNITGPTTGTCANWDGTSTMCMCGTPMAACTNDASCCGDLSCRRGASFGVRCCTESTGTCTTGADCCGYMDCTAGRCVCRAAGRGCLDNRDCCSGTCTTGRCA